jgi:hypothetical protein
MARLPARHLAACRLAPVSPSSVLPSSVLGGMTMRILIAGAGGMGFYLSLCLAAEHRITVYDDDTAEGMRNRLIVPSTPSAAQEGEVARKVEILAFLDHRVQIVPERLTAANMVPCDVIVDATDLSSSERQAIAALAREHGVRYIRASYDYVAARNEIKVSVSDGVGFETSDAHRGYNSRPSRRVAMLAGAWAANIISYYLFDCISLPKSAIFTFEEANHADQAH